jgi:hypothetical protein
MGSRRYSTVLGSLLLVSMIPAPVGAEPTSDTSPSHALSWRGHPYPECRFFLVSEVGMSHALGNTPTRGGSGVIAADLGLMKNISERAAVGGTVHARLGEDYARAGVRARYRRWLGRSTSLDLSPGIIVVEKDDYSYDYVPPGFVAGAAWNLRDLFALSLEAEYSRYSLVEYVGSEIHRSHPSEVIWRVGWRTGYVPGGIGMVFFIAGGILYTMVLGDS